MNLSNLSKIVIRSKKRVGRGIGSGKGGHTSSRGSKGQKARTKVHPLFEGTKVKKSLIKRLPYLRGKGKFKSWKDKSVRYVSKKKEVVKPAAEKPVVKIVKSKITKKKK